VNELYWVDDSWGNYKLPNPRPAAAGSALTCYGINVSYWQSFDRNLYSVATTLQFSILETTTGLSIVERFEYGLGCGGWMLISFFLTRSCLVSRKYSASGRKRN
jgi:hypothetical protein